MRQHTRLALLTFVILGASVHAFPNPPALPVPEPAATLGLLVLASVFAVGRRRRKP